MPSFFVSPAGWFSKAPTARRRASWIRRDPRHFDHRDPGHAFLHIGKTGGSSIGDFLISLTQAGEHPPMTLGHQWTLELFAAAFPEARLAILLRDPLERAISGFNSRLRQGRPRGNFPWTDAEAIAFAHFHRVEDYLAACISTDHYLQSAARFATSRILHIRFGYRHYMGSADDVRAHRDRIYCIGETADMESFARRMLQPSGIDFSRYATLLTAKHLAAQPSSRYLEALRDRLPELRAFFADEYATYQTLVDLRAKEPG